MSISAAQLATPPKKKGFKSGFVVFRGSEAGEVMTWVVTSTADHFQLKPSSFFCVLHCCKEYYHNKVSAVATFAMNTTFRKGTLSAVFTFRAASVSSKIHDIFFHKRKHFSEKDKRITLSNLFWRIFRGFERVLFHLMFCTGMTCFQDVKRARFSSMLFHFCWHRAKKWKI